MGLDRIKNDLICITATSKEVEPPSSKLNLSKRRLLNLQQCFHTSCIFCFLSDCDQQIMKKTNLQNKEYFDNDIDESFINTKNVVRLDDTVILVTLVS